MAAARLPRPKPASVSLSPAANNASQRITGDPRRFGLVHQERSGNHANDEHRKIV